MVFLRVLSTSPVGANSFADFFSDGLTAFRSENLTAVGSARGSAGKSQFFSPAFFINRDAINDAGFRTFNTLFFCDIAVRIIYET